MGYIKNVVNSDGTHLIEPILYATTAGTASAITLAISNFELVTGVVVTAKIATANNASATLNVNATGEKKIRYNNADIAAGALKVNRFYSFLYDGTYWQLIGELDTNTTYTAGTGIAITDNTIRNTGVREITTSSSNGALKVNTNGTETAVFVKGIEDGYLNIHPENTPILIPFIHNDIAHLLKRGGSATISYDGVTQSNLDLNPCFNGSGSYWSVSGNINTIVIELILFKVFTWTSTIYVDFGSASWRAKSVKIEAMNTNYTNDTWTVKLDTTSNNSGHVSWLGTHTPNGASNGGGGFNKLRFTFSNFNSISTSGGSFRISQIGIYNYASLGLREPYMSRGEDDPVFRSITPNITDIYYLGSDAKKWKGVYATNFYGSGANLTNLNADNLSAGTVAIANGGTNATTAASARTNLGLGSMATETATNYLKWQTTSKKSTELYDFGVYLNKNNAAQSGPRNTNYYSLINIPYYQASGYTKLYYGWQIGGDTNNNSRLWFRTTGDAVYSEWQEIAHAPYSTNDIGSATQPVYMTATGVITAGTALKALAYKDNLVASDIPDISGTYATKTYVNNVATHTLNTTIKYYVTGTTSATTSTGGDSFDTGVYVTATAGELSAVKHSFNVSGTEKATMQYNNDIESIVFSFV